MDEREQERLRLAREVGKLLLHRSFRDALPPLREDGSRPFVVGLPEDTMKQITARVAALGGDAHLIVMTPTRTPGTERVQVLRVTEGENKPLGDLDESYETPVSEDSTLAILMDAIEVDQTFYVYATETVIRFISDSVQPIPA
ncbi:MAG TPA: hypothetical protein VEM58_02990 [Streptosporangiaceae bacterium]|nr:hypothetical protein [Streptosporangiaceae bacterium]